jgi:uncharacterized protein (TIGR03437 family)
MRVAGAGASRGNPSSYRLITLGSRLLSGDVFLKRFTYLIALIVSLCTFKEGRAQVSAASYQPVVAPNSLVSLFGSGFSDTTFSAQLDANGQLPTTLGGVSVQISGVAAPLLFVSPLQINLLVPANTGAGAAEVVVQTSTPGKQIQYTMQLRNVAPALFSKDASGRGPGAVLNAATFGAGPFLVETPENAGVDKRTRLAVFATGLRYAGNAAQDPTKVNVAAQIQARDSLGNVYTVEYAGPAPGFFGLDQINLVVPAAADGAGEVSLTITAEKAVSNTITFNMTSLPSNAVHLTGLTLSKTSVTSGNDVTGTVLLNGRARSGGYTVNFTTNGFEIKAPNSFTVMEGQASGDFTVHTTATSTTRTETLTAMANGFSSSASLQIVSVNAPRLTGLSLSANPIKGGTNLTGTLTLSGMVPIDGVSVQLASNNANVQAPPAVTFTFAQTLASFPITTTAVTNAQSATITAGYGDSTATATLTVRPALTIQLTAAAVTGGSPVGGEVTLAETAAAGGVIVNLHSSNSVFASVPATAVVPGGQSSASFTVSTLMVNSSQAVLVSATTAGVTATSALTINPANLPSLTGLTINPAIVQGGITSLATITLSGPAPVGGLLVDLQSDNAFAAQVPAFAMVPGGAPGVSVPVKTTKVSSTQTVTITATAGGISKSTTLKVQ